jgi:hypothetical protein
VPTATRTPTAAPTATVPASATATSPAAAPGLKVNEVDYDQPGTDNGEFVELVNTTDTAINLDSFHVLLVNGGAVPPVVYRRYDLPAVLLLPGDYFVICGDRAFVPNCDLDTSPNLSMIDNGAPDAVAVVRRVLEGYGGYDLLQDSVSYEGNTAGGPSSGGTWTEGSGVGLVDDGVFSHAGIARYPDGVDTGRNNVDLSCQDATPGEANVATGAACGAGTLTTPTPLAH